MRRISLSLCGGLILALCVYILASKHPKINTATTEKEMCNNPAPNTFSILDDVTATFIPSLKNTIPCNLYRVCGVLISIA